MRRTPKNKATLLYIAAMAAIAVMLTACNHRTVYHHYEQVDADGWERTDTLFFHVNAEKTDRMLLEEIGLRVTDQYPFTATQFIIEQTMLPGNASTTDTLECLLTDNDNNFKGPGFSAHQLTFPVKTFLLPAGDSLRIAVHHNMRRSPLQGITDIGIHLTKQ